MSAKWPSVTQVLSVYADFSRIRPDILERAARRGTRVHETCAAIATGLWAPDLAREEQGYVRSFQKWFSNVQRVHAVETELFHPVYRYMGHLDLCVTMQNEPHVRVVDLKTPLTEAPTWKAQLAAYSELVRVNMGLEPQRCGSLQLHPDGSTPRFREYQEQARDLAAFLNALAAYNYFRKGE